MSSDNAQSEVTYTSISSNSDGPSWGIPLMNSNELSEIDPSEEVAQQGQVPPLSPAYVPDPIELGEHVPVYVLEPEHPEYHASSDDDIQVKDQHQHHADDASPTAESHGYIADSDSIEEDDDEDPSEAQELEDDDEDLEEDPNEEHEPEDEDIKSPLFLLPPTSPAYDQAPLGYRAAMIRKRDEIPEEDMPPRRRFVFIAHSSRCDVTESSVAARAPRGQYDFVDTVKALKGLIRCSGHDVRTIARAADRAKDVDIRLEIDVVRGHRTAYETKLQEVRHAYLSFEARNRALLARLDTLETHMSHMEWQHQSVEDLAVTQIMRIHALTGRAQTDTVEDVENSSQVPSLQTLPSFSQQYPCCKDCGVTHEPYQCQPKNHDYYHEQNSCYDSNSFGFDHGQPPQYTVNHPIFNAHNAFLDSQNELTITQNKIIEQMTKLTSMCEMACQIIQKKQEEKRIEEKQAAKAKNSKILVCYDDDDDYFAITTNEPVDSLSMGDEHLDTILATESNEFIKSCIETLVPNPSESEGENGCDVPACFTTFSNILFDAEHESVSSDYQSCSDEDFLKEIFSNPLFEEEIISIKIDQHHFNAKSNLIESLLNRDSSMISSSSKIDSLLDEFAGELTLLKSIPPGIDGTDCHPENEIHFTERLLYDNSSSRPPEEFVYENSDADIESFSPSPIPNKDSDSFMEEIDLTFNLDDLVPPGIEDDDDDSERDILIYEELLENYSLSLPVNESFYFDIPSFSRPPAKPPDSDAGILNIKMLGDIYEQKVPMPRLMITLASNQEKSPDLLSHQGLKICKLSAKCPMMIHEKNIPTLDVPLFYFYPLVNSIVQYSRKLEDSCQRILSSKSSYPQLQLGIISQPMLKSSYKAEDGVIISIPSLIGGVADVVVEIKGT
nr:hypothetical protein [Tanacetum cinerariifolium]